MDNHGKMRASTLARREDDLTTLATCLEKAGAYEGITHIGYADVSLDAIQRELDWSSGRMRATLDFAADNPQYGIAFHIKRGRRRLIVLSYDNVSTEATPFVQDMVEGELHENLKRQIRSWCKGLVRLKRADRARVETKRFQWEVSLQEKLLRDVKFALEMQNRERFATEIAKIEAALSL